MTSTRIGFAEDFSLKNQLVGIGTNEQEVKLRVVGTIKGDFNVKDKTTLSVYGGFIVQNYNIDVPSVLSYTLDNVGTFIRVNERETDYLKLEGEYNALSEDIIVDEDRIFEVSDNSIVSVGTLESVSIQSHFSVPDGGTTERPDQPIEGMVRFNDDLNTLEFYNGIEWRQFTVTGASGRGVIMGGRNTPGATVSEIDFIQVTTLGNSQSFGDLQSGNMEAGACCADSTRALKTGGTSGGSVYDNIDYITIASQGNSIDFGNLQAGTRGHGCCSSSSRGVTGGGVIAPNSDTNRMDYFEIQTLGNALDFGDLVVTERNISMISSPTRGVHDGGNYPSTTTLGHFAIASKGNSIEFGSNSRSAYGGGVVGNNIRGIFCGGYNASGASEGIKKIEYITFSSLGKTTNFGELSGLVSANNGGMSNNSRGVIGPGNKTFTGSVDYTNTLEYITISTLGNSQDFGDVSGPMRTFSPKVSDSHGGLGGF